MRDWGRSVALTLYFFAYSDVVLTLTFSIDSAKRLDATQLGGDLGGHPIIRSVFNAAAHVVGQKLIPAVEDQKLIVTFGFRVEPPLPVLAGEPLLALDVKGRARMVSRQFTARVHGYGAPSQEPAARDALVERYSLGETSVVHDGSRISVHIDLNSLELPPLHQFRYAKAAGQETVDFDVFSISGPDALYVQKGSITIEIIESQ